MKAATAILKNEDGNAIVIAIMVMVLLTIIGTSATQNTTTELQIVRNDIVHKDQLHRAEAAAMEGAQWLENSTVGVLEDLSLNAFISQNEINLAALDLNDGTWEKAGTDPVAVGNNICGYRIVDETGPIDLGATSWLHVYTIYGLYDRTGGMNRGQALIAIGYKRRF
ncbi:MAG: PilX N-terminal domain-containing pilus assembly protein [Desulfobacterales bacterium]|jgi:hypothetical protein